MVSWGWLWGVQESRDGPGLEGWGHPWRAQEIKSGRGLGAEILSPSCRLESGGFRHPCAETPAWTDSVRITGARASVLFFLKSPK